MAVSGWTRPDMLLRYTKAQAETRAATEARNLNLGNLLTTPGSSRTAADRARSRLRNGFGVPSS